MNLITNLTIYIYINWMSCFSLFVGFETGLNYIAKTTLTWPQYSPSDLQELRLQVCSTFSSLFIVFLRFHILWFFFKKHRVHAHSHSSFTYNSYKSFNDKSLRCVCSHRCMYILISSKSSLGLSGFSLIVIWFLFCDY